MTIQEIVEQISFQLGLPTNHNIEEVSIEQAVNVAFTELKRYMNTPVSKTVPYSTRLDLVKLGINTVKVLNVQAAYPRIGLNLTSIETGNVFEVAAAVNVSSGFAQGSTINLDPIMTQLAYSQLRNTLATDFQWQYDLPNQCVYCAHKSPLPAVVTVKYVPIFKDVSEITNNTWINYLIRLATAYTKIALGRSRSKYRVEGSNVTLDGEILLNEGNAELEILHNELGTKSSKLVVLN